MQIKTSLTLTAEAMALLYKMARKEARTRGQVLDSIIHEAARKRLTSMERQEEINLEAVKRRRTEGL